MPRQPQEGRALVRVDLDDLRDVGRHRLVVDIGGARHGDCGGRDGRDDGGDGASEDGAAVERCRGVMSLRGSLCAAGARDALATPAAGCQASVQAPLERLQVRRVQRQSGAACKGNQDSLTEHRLG